MGRALPSLVAVAVGLAVSALLPSAAFADGDPASDVLVGASVFYPFSPAVSASLQRTLDAETAAAGRAHFPIKVALIHAPEDLGAIPILFGKPQQYANFLEQEISFLNVKPLLLVVMPTGYGVRSLGPAATRAAAALRMPASGSTDDLARAAILAVPKLAAAAGHPIGSVPGAGAGASSEGTPVLPLVVLSVLAIATAGSILVLRTRRAARR